VDPVADAGGGDVSEAVVARPDRIARAANPPVALDEIDKAVIRELQVDGRLSYAQLGPLVGLSQAAVRQRVQRLIDRGVMQVVAVTDPQMLGFNVQALVGLRVEGNARAVARSIAELAEVDYVVVSAGRFDVLAEVVCEDNEQLLELVDDVLRGQPGVRSAEVFTYLHLEKQTYSWGTR
jgi:Lrp/AsnC family transcriptional regulator, regulator for asnA, asnC and gidA